MSSIERFEDIEVWKKARELTRNLYQFTSEGKIAKDFALRDQMRRAAVSVMSNIAEGFGRGGNKEYIYFLSLARGSVMELQSQLYVAEDTDALATAVVQDLRILASDTANLLGGFIRYLSRSDISKPTH